MEAEIMILTPPPPGPCPFADDFLEALGVRWLGVMRASCGAPGIFLFDDMELHTTVTVHEGDEFADLVAVVSDRRKKFAEERM